MENFKEIMSQTKRKKIFIFSHFMEIGGAEKALLGLLEKIDLQQYEVDLFLLRHEGELMKCIPNGINILPEKEQYTMLARPISEVIKKGHWLIAIARMIGKYAAILYDLVHKYDAKSEVAIEYSHKYTRFFMPKICKKKEYDLAISFLTPHYFVSEKVEARKKIAWIHTDYSSIQIDLKSEYKMWKKYDNIISISDMCTNAFVDIFPGLTDKIVLVENLIPLNTIKKQSENSVEVMPEKEDGEIALLSIGRFCEAKNFDNIPDICRRLRKCGCNVKWYIIGFGAGEKLIRKKIADSGMVQWVVLLGKKENPYPYIKWCDWYIQPSRFEGKAVTVQEAQILNKPVIITDYATSKSQIRNGIDGIIVPMDNSTCASSIAKVIQDGELKQFLVDNTVKLDYSGQTSIKKIYKLLED